jgi:putative transposase
MTGDVEEAVLEKYLSGISVKKVAGFTDALSKVKIGKDTVSRIARRLGLTRIHSIAYSGLR